MKRDYNKLHLGSITVRMPQSMIEALDEQHGAGQKYRDRSDVIRSLVSLAMQIESLMEVYDDPKKAKEFEEKLSFLFKSRNAEQTLETMSVKERSAIIFIAKHLNDKSVEQLVLDIKQERGSSV